jgi:hypothetical protein
MEGVLNNKSKYFLKRNKKNDTQIHLLWTYLGLQRQMNFPTLQLTNTREAARETS